MSQISSHIPSDLRLSRSLEKRNLSGEVEDDPMSFQNFDASLANNLVLFKPDGRIWNNAIAEHQIFDGLNILSR